MPGDAGYTKRLGVRAAIDPVQVAAAMESGPHVGSNVKNPFPSATSACSGFNRNGFVSDVGKRYRGGLSRRGVDRDLLGWGSCRCRPSWVPANMSLTQPTIKI